MKDKKTKNIKGKDASMQVKEKFPIVFKNPQTGPYRAKKGTPEQEKRIAGMLKRISEKRKGG